MTTQENMDAFNKKAVAYSSSGVWLIEIYKILKTAQKPLEFNCSPVEIVSEMRNRNKHQIKQGIIDLERIFKESGIEPKEIYAG